VINYVLEQALENYAGPEQLKAHTVNHHDYGVDAHDSPGGARPRLLPMISTGISFGPRSNAGSFSAGHLAKLLQPPTKCYFGGNPAEFSVHELAAGLCADVQTVFPGRSSLGNASSVLAIMTFQVSEDGIDLAPDTDGPAMEQVPCASFVTLQQMSQQSG